MWTRGLVMNDDGEMVEGWIYFAPHHDKQGATEFGGCVWFENSSGEEWWIACTWGGGSVNCYETEQMAREWVESEASQ